MLKTRRGAIGWLALACAAVAALVGGCGRGLAVRASLISPWKPIYQGVDYASGTATMDSRTVERVWALRIDTRAPGVRFHSTPRCRGWVAGKAETWRQTTPEFVAASHVQAAINANFFDKTGSYTAPGPAVLKGLAISDGQIVSPPDGTVSLLITRDNKARIERTTASTDLHGVWTAVSGLVQAVVKGAARQTWTGMIGIKRSRTGVGLSRDGRYVFLVALDGGQTGSGATVGGFGKWMVRLGVWQAINLDGGGSTSMALADGHGGARLLNVPEARGHSTLTERRVGNSLGVYALPLSAHDRPKPH